MKKVLIFYALLVVAVVIFAITKGTNLLHFNSAGSTKSASANATATVNGTAYKLIIAKSDAEKQKGLSGRNDLAKDTGMLFIFDKKDKYGFWMRDMKFPIDIIWINDDKIVDFVENAPAASNGQSPANLIIYRPGAEANYVLEVNAREITKQKIKKGDTVVLKGVR